MLTLPEVAGFLRVSPRTLRKYIGQGKIPPHLYSRAGGYAKGRLRFTTKQAREIQVVWAGIDSAPPAQRTGMLNYHPRRTGRPT